MQRNMIGMLSWLEIGSLLIYVAVASRALPIEIG
jgi:hypothetical protein